MDEITILALILDVYEAGVDEPYRDEYVSAYLLIPLIKAWETGTAAAPDVLLAITLAVSRALGEDVRSYSDVGSRIKTLAAEFKKADEDLTDE